MIYLGCEGCGTFPQACVAQLVEHVLGKDEVVGSIPIASSVNLCNRNGSPLMTMPLKHLKN